MSRHIALLKTPFLRSSSLVDFVSKITIFWSLQCGSSCVILIAIFHYLLLMSLLFFLKNIIVCFFSCFTPILSRSAMNSQHIFLHPRSRFQNYQISIRHLSICWTYIYNYMMLELDQLMYIAQCYITFLTPAQPSLINQVTPTTLDKLSIYNFLITATAFY